MKVLKDKIVKKWHNDVDNRSQTKNYSNVVYFDQQTGVVYISPSSLVFSSTISYQGIIIVWYGI